MASRAWDEWCPSPGAEPALSRAEGRHPLPAGGERGLAGHLRNVSST
jgi:hypothetical protein